MAFFMLVCRRGPRVLLCGSKDTGKSTLARMLCSYAARESQKPILVDVDVGQGQLGIPGTLGALPVRKPAHLETVWDSEEPLLMPFGHLSPSDNLKLYIHQIARLAEFVNKRCEYDERSNEGGVVINTCGYVRNQGYEAIKQTACAFEVDILLVLESERLYNDLRRDLPSFLSITNVPKSRGVVERLEDTRTITRSQRIRDYFKGINGTLNPHRLVVYLAQVRIMWTILLLLVLYSICIFL